MPDDQDVQQLERRAIQLQHELDGLREDVNALRWIRGRKDGVPIRGKT